MPSLTGRFIRLCERNPDGSYATRANRLRTLIAAGRALHELGYRLHHPRGLKPKHIEALVTRWQQEGQTSGTLKNKLSVLRWWAEKVDKRSVIARNNARYGVANRVYVTNENKACDVTAEQLAKVKDPRVRASLELQRAFGLRREEAIKFNPQWADRGDRIVLKATWTKGGKEREVPIRNEGQRAVLSLAHRTAGRGSLIEPNRRYVDQLRIYERQTANAGLSKLHGLRHLYAQERYSEFTESLAHQRLGTTGWAAPACGGPKLKELTASQKAVDHEARLTISQELGHERQQIAAIYLGR